MNNFFGNLRVLEPSVHFFVGWATLRTNKDAPPHSRSRSAGRWKAYYRITEKGERNASR